MLNSFRGFNCPAASTLLVALGPFDEGQFLESVNCLFNSNIASTDTATVSFALCSTPPANATEFAAGVPLQREAITLSGSGVCEYRIPLNHRPSGSLLWLVAMIVNGAAARILTGAFAVDSVTRP